MVPRPLLAAALALPLIACSSSGGASTSASASASVAPKKAAPPPSSAILREKPNEVPADPPMKPPLMPGSGAPSGPSVHGVALGGATPADVRAALEKQRCKVADAQGVGHATEATCDGHTFLVTFVAASDAAPDAAKLDAAQKGAAVARSGAASLSIQPKKPDDAKLAEDLLGRITSAP